MSKFHSLKIYDILHITQEAVILSIKVPAELESLYKYNAGQYINLELNIKGKPVRRSYSICSSPNSELLQVGVKKVPKGLFSTYVNRELKKGDTILVGIPEGNFIWVPEEKKTSVMAIAAGSGITPIVSIMKTVLYTNSNSTFTLIYGNKSPKTTMFYRELKTLESEFSKQLKIHWVFSQENVKGAHFGRIDSAYINLVLNQSKNTQKKYYLCGPEAMIIFTKNFLMRKGIDESEIYNELFTSSSEKTPLGKGVKKGVLKITCDEVTYTLDLIPNKTILDIALQAKLDVPYSCQGGVCSSCIGKIKEGNVNMTKNQILTDEEVQEGLVLTCQAIAQSQLVSLDYDDI